MKIAEIKNNSTAEVRGHFSDVIYFQGCSQGCPFCFNKTICNEKDGEEMTIPEIMSKLSHFSDVVVLTGGEPLEQRGIEELIKELRRKTDVSIVLETSMVDHNIYPLVDRILYSFKTFPKRPSYNGDLFGIHNNIDIVVVVGHKWFNMDRFKKFLKTVNRDLYIRYYMDKRCNIKKVLKALHDNNIPARVFDQLVL